MGKEALARAQQAERDWHERHDALLTVLNAILLAYGNGPDGRLRVVDHYVGQPRRDVSVEPVADGILVRLAPVKKEDNPDATSS